MKKVSEKGYGNRAKRKETQLHSHGVDLSNPYSSRLFLLGLLVFLLHCMMIGFLQVKPVSDFEVYYQAALGIISGNRLWDSYKYFQGPGYPYFLAVFFQIFKNHSILLPQIINSLMVIWMSILLMGHAWVKSHALRGFGFLVLTLNLNYLSMIPLIGSEVPYGFFFAVGLILLWLRLREMREGHAGRLKKILMLLFSGISLGVSQSIRPTTTPFLVLLSLILLGGLIYFHVEGTGTHLWGKMVRGIQLLFLLWCAFLLTAFSLYYMTSYGMRIQPGQNGLWNIYVGFNTESMGRWNPKDPELISKLGDHYQWDSKRINGDLWPIVLDRVKKNGLKNLELLPEKVYFLLDPHAIAYWPIEHSQVGNKNRIYKISYYLRWINAVVFVTSLWTWALWVGRRRISKERLFAFCVMGSALSNIVLHGYLLEVQPRYINHLWLILFWCFPLSLLVQCEELSIGDRLKGVRNLISSV